MTQILCEIIFWDSWSIKSAILTLREALTFWFLWYLHFQEAEIYQINKIQSFKSSIPSKIDSMLHLNDRKSIKFPHCVNILIFAEMDLAISKEKKRNKWKVCNRPFARVKTRLSSSKNQDVHFKCITRSGLSVRCIVKIAITTPPPPLSPNSPITTNNFCFNHKNSHLITDINVSVIAGTDSLT